MKAGSTEEPNGKTDAQHTKKGQDGHGSPGVAFLHHSFCVGLAKICSDQAGDEGIQRLLGESGKAEVPEIRISGRRRRLTYHLLANPEGQILKGKLKGSSRA